MLEMEIPPIILTIIQIIMALLTALILWILNKVSSELKDNTSNTITLAKNSAVTDTKVDTLMKDMHEIRPRVHRIAEQVTILETTERVRKEVQTSRRSGKH